MQGRDREKREDEGKMLGEKGSQCKGGERRGKRREEKGRESWEMEGEVRIM